MFLKRNLRSLAGNGYQTGATVATEEAACPSKMTDLHCELWVSDSDMSHTTHTNQFLELPKLMNNKKHYTSICKKMKRWA